MYTVEAFIPYREPEDPEDRKSYPVYLGANTLLSILPKFTETEVTMTLLASHDLIQWFTVADECDVIWLDSLDEEQAVTFDPRIMLPYPYMKIRVTTLIPVDGLAFILSIGDVT